MIRCCLFAEAVKDVALDTLHCLLLQQGLRQWATQLWALTIS